MKTSTRIILVGVLCSLIPLVIIGHILLTMLEEEIKIKTLETLDRIGKGKKNDIIEIINLRSEIVQSLSSRTAIRENLALYNLYANEVNLIKMEKIISDATIGTNILELSIVGIDGSIVVSTNNNSKGKSISNEPYFQTLSSGKEFIDFVQYGDSSGLFFVHPLIYEDQII